MQKYKVIVTDNETGEILLQKEGNAVITSVTGRKDTSSFNVANSNVFDICSNIKGAIKSINEIYKGHPEIKKLVELMDTMEKNGILNVVAYKEEKVGL